MDDKILVTVDTMLAQAIEALLECRRALVVSGSISPEQAVRSLRAATDQGYMSGRWRRRDGDIFGIASQAVKAPGEKPDADSPPGNIRPPDER